MLKFYVIKKGDEYVYAGDENIYTKDINKAFVYYDKFEAKCGVTEHGEKIVEVITKNKLVKRK